MKKLVLLLALVLMLCIDVAAQVEYKVITSVESIVSSGLGRSRIVSASEDRNYKDFTSSRSDEDDERNKSDRGEIRVKNFEETKLLNFFNLGGIRFQNIAANDAVVTSKINTMVEEGWELAFVTSAVESDGGKDDGQGIFITRYIFKRQKSQN
ncbi:hypothetical protein GCM10011531_25710 [Aquaticitalea lipolytica]|jgi:hypothetical protein|uniref:DUF4177 domain-containing protein n=1 Tax=Aquaticitalea lipolytica TaxID=1247562 RepID=A0A8J2TT45_9FLAO|nr:hypothetical protein [Aquaticitalea lipolytica]GFZ92764.1 hypothetical protein GCM10011531_25710 [Aquaticitalea lipolytica]